MHSYKHFSLRVSQNIEYEDDEIGLLVSFFNFTSAATIYAIYGHSQVHSHEDTDTN